MQLHFSDCVIDCDRYEFVRAGQRVDVQPKVWAFLRLLAENAHRLLPKDEILERLWPDVTVAEGSLQRLASLARARSATRGCSGPFAAWAISSRPRSRCAARRLARQMTPPTDRSPTISPASSSQVIRFCRTIDGANVAWASVGRGPALVRALGWFTNLEYEWAWPHARRFWELLGEGRRLIRYDGRGMGLSDPWSDFSPELRLRDLEAVVAASGEQRFDLVGLSEGCGTALAFAVRNPSRVRRLVLYGPPAFHVPGCDARAAEPRPRDARAGEGRLGRRRLERLRSHAGAALRRPDRPTPRRASSSTACNAPPPIATRRSPIFRAMAADARDAARKLSVPTLVVHRRDDAIAPFESAKAAASLIPGRASSRWPATTTGRWRTTSSAPVMIRSITQFLDEA